jgi:hypothetical protein
MSISTRQRFTRALDRQIVERDFFWLDIYSRLDPVPAGDLDQAIINQLGIPAEKIKRRRVVNIDNPITDHDCYFPNKDEVMPRIARAINGGKEYPWAEAGITEKKLRGHKTRVAFYSLLRLSIIGIFFWQAVILLDRMGIVISNWKDVDIINLNPSFWGDLWGIFDGKFTDFIKNFKTTIEGISANTAMNIKIDIWGFIIPLLIIIAVITIYRIVKERWFFDM